MAQGTTPVEQRRLRAELRRIREAAGRTQRVVADDLGWSISKVIRLETGAVNVSTSDLMALLHYYEVKDASRTEELLAITRGKDHAWWDKYHSVYTQQFLNYLGYEDSALQIRQFCGLVIPGLLQTKSYMRSLFTGYMEASDAVERGVQVRTRRQEILTRDDAAEVLFVIDEAVLHRWVGGPEVMIEQLTRLKTAAEHPNISIRIVPFTSGVHPGMQGSFTIFELPAEVEDYIVVLEAPGRDVVIRDDPDVSSRYLEFFNQLQDIAQDGDDMHDIIDPLINSMRQGMND